MRTLLMMLAMAAASTTHAATVTTDVCPLRSQLVCVQSVSDLDIEGTRYNVEFVFGSFDSIYASGTETPFTDLTSAFVAGQALAAELNTTAARRVDYGGGAEIAFFQVPFIVSGDIGYSRWGFGVDAWENRNPGALDSGTAAPYAVFSTVVPIPAAVWLFGSALFGLGWFRRAS